MRVPYRLREDAEEMGRADERLTLEIEETERRIVELRRKREDVRFNRVEALATADFLDRADFKVERDESGIVTVSVDPAINAAGSR